MSQNLPPTTPAGRLPTRLGFFFLVAVDRPEFPLPAFTSKNNEVRSTLLELWRHGPPLEALEKARTDGASSGQRSCHAVLSGRLVLFKD